MSDLIQWFSFLLSDPRRLAFAWNQMMLIPISTRLAYAAFIALALWSFAAMWLRRIALVTVIFFEMRSIVNYTHLLIKLRCR